VATLELLGTGVVVAWFSLPVLTRAARPLGEHAPDVAYRRLFAALALSVGCLTLPWLRALLPRFTDSLTPVALSVQVLATPVGDAHLGPLRGYVISPFDLLGLAWGAACAVAAVRWAVARARLSRLLSRAVPAPQPLQHALTRLARDRAVSPPPLLLSPDAAAPFSVGALAPRVVLPTALAAELSSGDLELVLQHELAHLKRRDPLTHALTRLFAVVFAYHPTVPGLLRELVIAREAAVDAKIAIADRHAYATLLLQIASRARFGQDPAHVSMDDTALTRRIAMLTHSTPAGAKPPATRLFVTASAIAGLGLFSPHVFAEPARFHAGPLAAEDPMAAHEAEIDECYELARAEDADLVVSTRAHFEVDPQTFRVASADVPTPESPIFQHCVEERAMSWSFPPPPGMPHPPKGMPKEAKLMVVVRIERAP
jgi:Zn-dependent protease with chaperone function